MDMLCRAYEATVKVSEGEERTVTSIVNTASVDRYKTVINPGGIDLVAYRKNPVVLWEHGKDPTRGSRPIGRNLWIKQVGDTIQAKTRFGSDAYSQEIFNLYKDGLLSGWSINVLPDRDSSSPPTKDELRSRPDLSKCEMVYRKGELAEYSAVAVPGNSETLTILEQRGIWVPEELRAADGQAPQSGQEDEEDEEDEDYDEGEESEEVEPDEYEGEERDIDDDEEGEDVESDDGDDDEESTGREAVRPGGSARALRYIRKKGSKWVVYSHGGKVLGKHSSRAKAAAQLGAIEASKARRRKGRHIAFDDGVYRVMDGDSVILSTPSYDIAVECFETMGDRWRNFESIHESILRTMRQEHALIRSDVMAMLELALSGKV